MELRKTFRKKLFFSIWPDRWTRLGVFFEKNRFRFGEPSENGYNPIVLRTRRSTHVWRVGTGGGLQIRTEIIFLFLISKTCQSSCVYNIYRNLVTCRRFISFSSSSLLTSKTLCTSTLRVCAVTRTIVCEPNNITLYVERFFFVLSFCHCHVWPKIRFPMYHLNTCTARVYGSERNRVRRNAGIMRVQAKKRYYYYFLFAVLFLIDTRFSCTRPHMLYSVQCTLCNIETKRPERR